MNEWHRVPGTTPGTLYVQVFQGVYSLYDSWIWIEHSFVSLTGYTGTNCELQYNECVSNPCLNGGQCVDELNSYQCHCPGGYFGVHCEMKRNFCESNPCHNASMCVDETYSYRCICEAGFTGKLIMLHIYLWNNVIKLFIVLSEMHCYTLCEDPAMLFEINAPKLLSTSRKLG